jgi:uncharacterized membrane protein
VITWLWDVLWFICSQDPVRSWSPGGIVLPVCERCTGLYAGSALALLAFCGLRVRCGVGGLLAHSGGLLLMIPLGLHWVPHGPVLRTMSGVLFGFGVVAFLWRAVPPRWTSAEYSDRRWILYGIAFALSLLAVPTLAARGGYRSFVALISLVTMGLGGLAVLSTGVAAAQINTVSLRLTDRVYRALLNGSLSGGLARNCFRLRRPGHHDQPHC